MTNYFNKKKGWVYECISTVSVVVMMVMQIGLLVGVSKGQKLKVGYYGTKCPAAEAMVMNVVQQAFSLDPQTAPSLLRLSFHDCFVQGCDGSVLINNGDEGERGARGNAGLRGFQVIDNAKTQLESLCPSLVSCADILALAARDAVFLSGGPSYEVPTGRRDGRVSNVSMAANLPDVDDPIQTLISKFKDKGLSVQDLVLLSAGGHTIGTTACFFMSKRLYNYSGNGNSDPSISPNFLLRLKSTCPFNGDVNVRLPLDWSSEFSFDDHILLNIRSGFAVIASDARLHDDADTRRVLDSYIGGTSTPSFGADFAEAMVKMGNIGVKTGVEGEIRRVCGVVN